MANRFQKRRARKLFGFVSSISFLVVIVGCFELYRWIIPFQSENPLFHEVTIGENVIHQWKYGGQDEEGYLRFYNGQQTVVLPPNSRMFDADGQFVVIERYTPSSLTYAEPLEALPFKWVAVTFMVLGLLISAVYWKVKHLPKKMIRHRTFRYFDDTEGLWQKIHSWKLHSRERRFKATTKKRKSKNGTPNQQNQI